ncbi:MAG: hypothetical protein Q9218_001523 [Villophora microphyllina]
MADPIAEKVRLLLPWELRIDIYFFIFSIDLEAFKIAQGERDFFQRHGFPSRSAFMQHGAYRRYRAEAKHFEADARWPDHVERALFQGNLAFILSSQLASNDATALEDTNSWGREEPTPNKVLVSGSESKWAPILQSHGISMTDTRSRSQIISDIIHMTTGHVRNRKHVSSHLQVLKDIYHHSSYKDRSYGISPVISAIASMSARPNIFAMHDALYGLLQNKALIIDDTAYCNADDSHELRMIVQSVTSGFRHAIKHLQLTYTWDNLPRFIQLLRREALPGLQTLYMDLRRTVAGKGLCKARGEDVKGALYILEAALGTINPGVRVQPVLEEGQQDDDQDPNRWSTDGCQVSLGPQ